MLFALSRSLLCASLVLPALQEPDDPLPGAGVEWGPWSVLLPFDHAGGGDDLDEVHPPEKELRSMRLDGKGPDFSKKYRGKGGQKIQWRPARAEEPPAPDTAKVDFLTLVPEVYEDKSNKLTAFSAAYAHRSLTSPRGQTVRLGFGSDDGAQVWLNGNLVHDKAALRAVKPGDDLLELELQAGVNHLLVKVCNEGGGWGCQLGAAPGPEEEAPESPRAEIQAAIGRGAVYLLKTQNLDGSWSFEGKGYRNGQTALSLYALLKCGLTEDHQAIQRGLAFLRGRPPRRTYSAACQILALAATKNPEHHGWIEEIAEELLEWQEVGFGYPDPARGLDLSNTQYGALGLWVASSTGFEVPERTWLYLTRSALAHQGDGGGFAYKPGGVSTGSMTVAGLTVLAICEHGFGEGGLPTQLEGKVAEAKELGLAWLAQHFKSDEDPLAQTNRWHHYYLYGIERLAALMGLERFGDYDWYRQGAHVYLEGQGAEGQWGTLYGENEPNTAFGLIFLAKGTASLSGVENKSVLDKLYVSEGEEAELVLRASGDTPMSLWLSEVAAGAEEAHARDGDGGFGLYLERAEFLANGELIGTVELDASRPWSKERIAMQHRFERRGDYELGLRLVMAPDPLLPGEEPVVLESAPLAVRVDALLEGWMLDYPGDSERNLGLDQRKTAGGSSKRVDAEAAAAAFDGLQGTAWICAATDAAPELSVRFKKGVRCDRIVLSHASSKELWRNHFDRATRVSVALGTKREPIEYELDPDEERKSVLELPRTSKISELVIRVLEREPGTKHPGCVGFAEVELRMGD